MAEFSQYFDAVTSRIAAAPVDVGANANAKLALNAYNQALTEIKGKGEGEIPTFAEWRKGKELDVILPTITDSAARTKAMDDAAHWIDSDQKILDARTSLMKDGKVVLGKAKGIFDNVVEFLKNNAFSAGALAIGAVAGNALGLGTIGTLLLAVGGAVAGAVLGDKGSSFIGKMFGLDTPKVPGNAQFVQPGTGPVAGVFVSPTSEPTPVKPDQVLATSKVQEYTGVKPPRSSGDLVEADKFMETKVSQDRKQQFVGVRNASTGNLDVMYVRLVDVEEPKQGEKPKLDTQFYAIPRTGPGSLSLPVNDKGEVIYTPESSAKVIEVGNNAMKALASRQVVAEIPELAYKVSEKVVPSQMRTRITIRDDTGMNVIGVIEGEKIGDKFVISASSNSGPDNNSANLTKFSPQDAVSVPLVDGKLDLNKALEVVRKGRTAEANNLRDPNRKIVLEETAVKPGAAPDERMFTAKVRTDSGKPAAERSEAAQIEFKAKIVGTGDATKIVITEPMKLDGIAFAPKAPIEIQIGKLDLNKPDDMSKVIQKISEDKGFRDVVRPAVNPQTGINMVNLSIPSQSMEMVARGV